MFIICPKCGVAQNRVAMNNTSFSKSNSGIDKKTIAIVGGCVIVLVIAIIVIVNLNKPKPVTNSSEHNSAIYAVVAELG